MTAVEPVLGRQELDLHAGDRRRLNALWRQVSTLAGTKLVPKEHRDDVETIFGLSLYGDRFGLSPIQSLTNLYLIEGRIQPSAQLYASLALRAGHELYVEETSSSSCTVAVRRLGSELWQRVTWTIEDARRAGRLDVWVERWIRDGERNRKETWVVTPDQQPPPWAEALIEAGQTKRHENWWRYPDDMLAAAAVRRAVKRFLPDVTMWFDDGDDEGLTPQAVIAAEQSIAGMKVVDVDDSAEVELVEEHATPGGGDDDSAAEAMPGTTVSPGDVPGGIILAHAEPEPNPLERDGGAEETSEPWASSSPPVPPTQALPISEPQKRALHALLRRAGIVGPARHPYVSQLIGRTISSVNDLTAAEASRAIDALQEGDAQCP